MSVKARRAQRESVDAQIADQLTEAFAEAAKKLHVAPRAFDPEATPTFCLPTRGYRKPIVLAAVIALLAGALVVITVIGGENGDPEIVTGPGRTRLDPELILDYIAPVNGDAWDEARFQFRERELEARASMCQDFLITDWSSHPWTLPPLARIEREGTSNAWNDPPLISAGVLPGASPGTGNRCHTTHPPVVRWLEAANDLQDLYRPLIDVLITKMEDESLWNRAGMCMVSADIPYFDVTIAPYPSKYQAAVLAINDLITTRIQAEGAQGDISPEKIIELSRAESVAFVRCVTPFFAEVEKALRQTRAEFVAQHRDEFAQLRQQFGVIAD